jgi:hypothetical protein
VRQAISPNSVSCCPEQAILQINPEDSRECSGPSGG